MLDENQPGAIDAGVPEQSEQIQEEVQKELPDSPVEEQDQDTLKQADGNTGKKKLGGWQRKLMRLERENAELKAQLTAPKIASPEIEPHIDDFPDVHAYNKALARYEASELLKERDNREKQAQELRLREEQDKNWQERLDSLDPTVYGDYEEVVSEAFKGLSLPKIPHAFEVISEAGPEVVYHLAKDTDLLQKMENMTPLQLAKELVRIEKSIKKPEAKVSKLPAPITPPKGSVSVEPDLTKMDFDSFYRHRYGKKK